MRFSELSIQTQRAAPADIRTEGFALLYRAGYLSRAGELLPLGQRAVQRLAQAYDNPEFSGAPQAFFDHLGLPTAHSVESGEYFAVFAAAADEILACPTCGYADRREMARCRRQPFSSEAPQPLEKILTPESSTIAQLALFMDIPQQKTCKALMFTRPQDGKFIFVAVRGDLQMSEAKLKALVGDVRLATQSEISAVGAVAGYASPVGLQDAYVVLDELVARSPNLVAGANQAGYHLKNTNHLRDYQADLVADVCLANPSDECPACGTPLQLRAAAPVFSNGQPLFDGLLLALAETQHDEKGLTLPASASPFEIYLMNVPGKTLDTASAAETLYSRLTEAGLPVLFDDRNERAGVKFNDADLIGCPVRVTVGERGMQNGTLEVKLRREVETRQVQPDALLSELRPG